MAPLLYRVRPAAVLDVAGPDREAFLQGQLTQDVRLAASGGALPAAGLSPKGKLIFVAKLAAAGDRLRLVLPSELRETVLAHLKKYAVFQKVSFEDRTEDFVRIGIRGEEPAPVEGGIPMGRDGEFDDDRLVPADSGEEFVRALVARGGRPLTTDEAEVLRVEAGRPRFGQDFDESNLPDEVGLDDAISTSKGCYVGQEIVARMRTYGRANRRIVGFRFPDGGILAGSRLERPGSPGSRAEPGRVTTSVVSDRFGAIGLGWAFHDVPLGAELVSEGAPPRRAVVAGLPFAFALSPA
jgi:folate-binding protein YgfZ